MHPDIPLNQILIGDCRELLKTLPDASVHCVVTSPPYWGLRSYGTDPQIWQNGHEPCVEHQWGDEGTKRNRWGLDKNLSEFQANQKGNAFEVHLGTTCSICGAWRGELGLEPTPELYVAHLVQIFREVRRVLRDDGTIWVNLGDSYNTGTNAPQKPSKGSNVGNWNKAGSIGNIRANAPGLKVKDLVGIPWLVAFALRADGWYLRSDIIWAKPNPMPESVTDRPTKAHEYIFLMSKSQRYYYDADAVREPISETTISRFGSADVAREGPNGQDTIQRSLPTGRTRTLGASSAGRNRRTVWTVPTAPFKGAHFATFPPKLIEPCILAGCPVGGVVLDPFMGSGTTASVCISLKRNYIGFDLNPAYVEDIAQDRADNTPPPLFVL